MEKLSYIKPQSEIVALNNQSALLAGSVPGTSESGAGPGGNLIGRKRFTGCVEIDPASWDYTLWNESVEELDTDNY